MVEVVKLKAGRFQQSSGNNANILQRVKESMGFLSPVLTAFAIRLETLHEGFYGLEV